MSFHGLSRQDERFRAEVREFLARELTPETVQATDHQRSLFPPPSVTLPWQRKLLARRWLAPHWPTEFGGSGWTAMQHFIFETEAGRVGAPLLAPFGLKYLGPVLIRFGTQEQRRRFLPRILNGEDYWCQGYSEPNAGSDLAGLQCTAHREGNDYILNGTKLWTTHAQYANWIFCLVRTDNEVRPQAGISFLLVDLSSPGVTVRPILSITGEHEVNQVFFDAVGVPANHLVGAEGEGWAIARYLLEFERGSFIMSGLIRRKLERCQALARDVSRDAAEEGRVLLSRISDLEIDLLALEAAELRGALDLEAGRMPGAEASLIKIEFSELMQRIEELALTALGQRGLQFSAATSASDEEAIVGTYFNNRATTIYGGSNEIQRELIAKHLVGL
jgi:acyl-CoA dehydrogenase